MTKNELKKIIDNAIERRLEEFFVNDLPDIVSEAVNIKLKKVLNEQSQSKKVPLKDRILSSYEEMDELTFGERNENIKRNVSKLKAESVKPTNLFDKSKTINALPVNSVDLDGTDLDALAGADYDDSLLGL